MPAMNSQLLMIEDDHRLAQMVGEYLAQSSLQVTHMADGASGLARLQSPEGGQLPDLVILDLMLPDIDGLEVCRRIRALPAGGGAAPPKRAHGAQPGSRLFRHETADHPRRCGTRRPLHPWARFRRWP